MKLIDKSALVAEIERRIKQFVKENNTLLKNSDNAKELRSRIIMCKEVLSFLDTLEVKEVQEEPVSEELEDFAKRQADEFAEREYEGGSYDRGCLSKGYYWGCKAGAKWKAEQFEKERLKQCDTLTEEQAKIEQDFVVNFIKKNNCTPTFIDAIEYGMKLKLKDKK